MYVHIQMLLYESEAATEVVTARDLSVYVLSGSFIRTPTYIQ